MKQKAGRAGGGLKPLCGVATCQVVGLIWKVGDQMQSYLFPLGKPNFVFLGLFCFAQLRKTYPAQL